MSTETEVKTIKLTDPHTIAIVERFQRKTGTSTASKAATRMIERLDALETQSSHGSGGGQGKDTVKVDDLRAPDNSKVSL